MLTYFLVSSATSVTGHHPEDVITSDPYFDTDSILIRAVANPDGVRLLGLRIVLGEGLPETPAALVALTALEGC